MRPEAMKQVSLSDNIDCFASLVTHVRACLFCLCARVLLMFWDLDVGMCLYYGEGTGSII